MPGSSKLGQVRGTLWSNKIRGEQMATLLTANKLVEKLVNI